MQLRISPNPIMIKELRSRMRGGRAFLTLTVVLLLMAAFSYVVYQLVLSTMQYSGTPLSPQIGQSLLGGLGLLLLMAIAAVAPAVTAGAISGEQEKLTYEMLVATPMRPASILWGKLVSALSYLFLIIFAAIPMASLIFTFGGVTTREMLKALVILFIVTIMLGVLGLFFSALFKRSGRATVATYLVVATVFFGPFLLAAANGIIRQAEPPRWLLIPSPITALFSALAPSISSSSGMNVFYMIFGGYWGSWTSAINAPLSMTGIPRPLYHYSIPLYAVLTAVLYLVSTRLVQPTRRWHLTRREILVGMVILLVILGAIAGFFWLTSDRYENFSVFQSPTPAPALIEPFMMEQKAVPAQAVPYPAPLDEGTTIDLATPTPYPPPGG